MRILLFDIDGTLLTTSGGNRAFARAIETEFGIKSADTNISFSGRTDRGLLPELLHRNQVPVTGANCGRLRQAYMRFFEHEIESTDGTALPGVPALLAALYGRSDIVVAVMTGNFPESATRKLEHFQLSTYVSWVIGGDLDVERDNMALRATRLIESKHGPEALDDVIVIGDTPADIQCGHAIGARVLAVATGQYSMDQLQAASPWHLRADLSETDEVVALLSEPRQEY